MILDLFKFIHSVFGAISLYAGCVALSRIFAGRPFERSTSIFLQCALVASVTGLFFDIHKAQPSRLAAMAAVYVAGAAVLAWRGFHLTRSWGLVFALSLIGVLCLEVLVVVQHIFDWLLLLNATVPGPVKLLLLITESVVALFFTTMGIFAVRRYWNKPSHSLY